MGRENKYTWEYTLTWGDLFALIAPYLLENPNDTVIKKVLEKSVFEKTGKSSELIDINDQVYQTIKVQLVALGLVDIRYTQTVQGGMALFWILTPKGRELLFQLRTIKKDETAT